jgi:hypothetical protein
MKLQKVIGLALVCFVISLTSNSSVAKTCKCKDHDAKGVFTGSCSRTESSSYCTVKDKSSSASDEEFVESLLGDSSNYYGYQERIERMDTIFEKKFDTDIPLFSTYDMMENRDQISYMSSSEFENLVVNFIALSSGSLQFTEDFKRNIRYGSLSSKISDAKDQLLKVGCFLFEYNGTSVMFIAYNSKVNKECPRGYY